MNIETVMLHVEYAIEHRPDSTGSGWYLTYEYDQIVAKAITRRETRVIDFARFGLDEAINGFTQNQWRKIAGKINAFLEVRKICLKSFPQSQMNNPDSF